MAENGGLTNIVQAGDAAPFIRNKEMKSRLRWMAIAWTIVIVILCWMPRARLPLPEHTPSLFRMLHIDKVVHFGIFAVFAFLWRLASNSRATLLIAVVGVVFAIVTELVQDLPIVGRDADVWDGLADSAGVLTGLVFGSLMTARRMRVSQPEA